MKPLLLALAVLFAMPAHAWNLDVGKLLEVGKKAMDAAKPIDQAGEVEIGAGVASTMLGAAPLVNDPELQRYVNRVGTWLASHTERNDLVWHFGVTEDTGINAFAMPGGYILITRGLMQKLRTEAELAGVLGHEIAHVVQKHHLAAIQSGRNKELFSGVLDVAAAGRGSRDAATIAKFAKGFSEIYIKGLDKGDEYEADRMGVVIAARGGYTPYGLVGVLQTLSQMPGDGPLALMTSTHPTPLDRLDQLGAAMGEKLDDLPNRIDNLQRFGHLKR